MDDQIDIKDTISDNPDKHDKDGLPLVDEQTEQKQKNTPVPSFGGVKDERWDNLALERVEIWLKDYIKEFSIGKTLVIGNVARKSRDIAHILPSGNVDGIRHILGILDSQGYIKITDKKHFMILKKPE